MSRAAIIIGGILAFLALCFFCATCHGPAINQAAVPLTESSLWAKMIDGKIELRGTVPTEKIKSEITGAAKRVYGEGNVIDNQTVSTAVGEPAWMPSALGLFGLLKDGVKNSGFGIENGKLTVNGVVKNADAESKLLVDAQAMLPNLKLVDNVDYEAAKVQRNIGEFLDTRVVEFATGSAVLTPRGKAILDTVAMMLNEAPDAQIEVGGHTDDQGNDDANMNLSQRRADASEAYLIKKGIDDGRMTSKGFGETSPVADNATAEGRQRNRRIQFGLR
jgi:OOP family OmpA-OmpF porin